MHKMRKIILPIYSGIYKIMNIKNGKVYVGSAVNFRNRWRLHLCQLRKGTHHSSYLQNSYHKHGERNFILLIIEKINDKTKLKEREQFWKDFYKSYLPENGYDICPEAKSCLGVKRSKEFCEGISKRQSGRKISEESKRKMSDAKKGRKRPKELMKKIGSLNKGKKLSEEHKAKLIESNKKRKGEHHSLEHNAKIAASHIGKKRSPECIVKMKAKIMSPEAKDKISKSAKKQWADPKFKAKMIEIRRNRGKTKC